jgi:hypothetical protein
MDDIHQHIRSDLERTAVLITMQKGKVTMARRKMPNARDAGPGNPLANRTTLFLLDMGKWWLFRQLAPELPRRKARAYCVAIFSAI